MTQVDRLQDVLMVVVERPVSFIDFEPRGVPGFESDIAKAFGCSENQTDNLLDVIDTLAEDHHYQVNRVLIDPATNATKGKVYPRKVRVTVSPA